MFAKVVQFKDGTFAVRRWHILFGYQYLSVVNKKNEWFWWSGPPEDKTFFSFKTYNGAERHLRAYRTRWFKRESEIDYGKVVKPFTKGPS
jgi:hypothetical protein